MVYQGPPSVVKVADFVLDVLTNLVSVVCEMEITVCACYAEGPMRDLADYSAKVEELQ